MEPPTHDTHPSERGRDPAARMAGGLLILTALATLIAVIGRVSADADQPHAGRVVDRHIPQQRTLWTRWCGALSVRNHPDCRILVPYENMDNP